MFCTTLAFSILGASLAVRLAGADAPTGPSWRSGKYTVVPYTAKFDDANAGLVNKAPVRGITPLGPYDNLYYANLGVISDNTVGAGVPAHSLPNALGYDVVAELQGQQQIYADYDDSITDHFAFHSFYFGCVVSTEETASSTPAPCNVTLTGYLNAKQVARQTVSFQPKTGVLTAIMVKAQLQSAFLNVDSVTFSTAGLLASTAIAVLFDNLAYDVYLKPGSTSR